MMVIKTALTDFGFLECGHKITHIKCPQWHELPVAYLNSQPHCYALDDSTLNIVCKGITLVIKKDSVIGEYEYNNIISLMALCYHNLKQAREAP